MCESDIYIKGKEGERFMDGVWFVDVDGDKITFRKMFGEEKELKGYRIVKVDLLNHKILVERI